MSNWEGSVAVATTGSAITFTGIGFQPTHLKLTVGAKSNSSSVIQFSQGYVDVTGYYGVHSFYSDATGSESKLLYTKCLYHRERVAGTLTTVLEATFHSFTASGFKLNVTIANSSYDVWVTASNE